MEPPSQQPPRSACAEVTANPVPGSVAPGKEVTLQTETAGAVIYYTLNKTCPCDLDNEARKEYTGPIEITEDTYIIAYAVKEGYEAVGIEVTDAYYKLGSDRVRFALNATEEPPEKK